MVNEQRNITELAVTTATGVSQIDTPPVSHDPIETEPTEPGTMSPQTYLPNGSPPRPTATSTCRPQTWVQHISEGQIEEHSREDEGSLESDPVKCSSWESSLFLSNSLMVATMHPMFTTKIKQSLYDHIC